MAVSEGDVLHVAELARLALDPDRVAALVGELNGILGHMEALQTEEVSRDVRTMAPEAGGGLPALPLRTDIGPQLPLARAREEFGPDMRDGFFLVPRLATHEGRGERSP